MINMEPASPSRIKYSSGRGKKRKDNTSVMSIMMVF
jgi:hypothetical protein